MYLERNIKVEAFTKDAERQFGELSTRLDKVGEDLNHRMYGKTRGGLIGSFVVSGIWLVVHFFLILFADQPWGVWAMLITLALVATMIFDNAVGMKYYGAILSHQTKIEQLTQRISMGLSGIPVKQKAFVKAAENGWDYPIVAGASIFQEAEEIEDALSSMESLRSGTLNTLKNGLFYLCGVAVTVVTSLGLTPTIDRFVVNLFDGSAPSWVYYIGIAVTCVIQFIIAKFIWGETNCEVNNKTMIATLAGPVVFAILGFALPLIIYAVVWVVSLVISLAAMALAFACFCGSLGGG